MKPRLIRAIFSMLWLSYPEVGREYTSVPVGEGARGCRGEEIFINILIAGGGSR